MITARENVSRAIYHKGPEYLPVELGFYPEFMLEKNESKAVRIQELSQELKSDIFNPSTFVHDIGGKEKSGSRYTWVDEWGTGWEEDGFGSKSVYHPLEAGGYEELDTYAFPDSKLGPHILLNEEYEKRDASKYMRANVWFTLFERLWMLRGFENVLIDPYISPKEFAYLRDNIVDFNLERIEQWLKLGVDGIFFSDDWGTQRGLLISRDDWLKLYKPAYEKMYRAAHDGGADVWMHLCGDVRMIIPDLMDVGVNVLNPIQPQAMDTKELARDFGGKIAFYGGVDVQGTLNTGTPDEVRSEVFELCEILTKFNGGYIGGTSHTIMPEAPLDNIIALYEAFIEVQNNDLAGKK